MRKEPPLTVLLVEDEAMLRAAIRRLLEGEGYAVLEADQGAKALELLRDSNGQNIHLVLTDLRMPVMDGRQLAAALVRLYPRMPILFMSGFTAQLLDLRLVSPHAEVLAKPFRNHDLLLAVQRTIDQAG